ncbi:MAG: cobalamin [Acidimicrobiales bacterium]|nr:cobalamin [Acidimicrobiales bacterium]
MTVPTIVVLAAHGSRLAEANDAHRALAQRVAARLGADVRPAFLELSEPSIATAIDEAVAAGAARVLVLPYFLHPGNHTARDIPEIVAAARPRHPGAAIELLALFGADGAVDAVVADQARAALR